MRKRRQEFQMLPGQSELGKDAKHGMLSKDFLPRFEEEEHILFISRDLTQAQNSQQAPG